MFQYSFNREPSYLICHHAYNYLGCFNTEMFCSSSSEVSFDSLNQVTESQQILSSDLWKYETLNVQVTSTRIGQLHVTPPSPLRVNIQFLRLFLNALRKVKSINSEFVSD